jgi:hypothetical protein
MCNHKTTFRILGTTVLLLAFCGPCGADTSTREYQVKAAFIYNFTQFIDWPAGALEKDDSPLVVAVVGNDPFNGALEQAMANKTVGTHPIVVKHFASVDAIDACQLLFVPAAQDGSLGAILSKVGNGRILTVGETDAFIAAGGAIRLYVDGGRMRFELDPDACDAAKLVVSAQLMKLAKIHKK